MCPTVRARMCMQVNREHSYAVPIQRVNAYTCADLCFRKQGDKAHHPISCWHETALADLPNKKSVLQHPPLTSHDSRTEFPAEDQALLSHSLRPLVIDYVV